MDQEPKGTFECPVCGFDKPHHHGKEESKIAWHMHYRPVFEEIIYNNIRRQTHGGAYIGHGYGIHVPMTGSFLGMSAHGARTYSGRVIAGLRQNPWSEFSRSSPFNGGYEQPWLDALWGIYKDTVIALINPPHRLTIGESE